MVNRSVNECIMMNDKEYVIPRDDTESKEIYLKRINYIMDKMDKTTNITMDELIRRSRIWRNYKIYGMVYPSAVIKLL